MGGGGGGRGLASDYSMDYTPIICESLGFIQELTWGEAKVYKNCTTVGRDGKDESSLSIKEWMWSDCNRNKEWVSTVEGSVTFQTLAIFFNYYLLFLSSTDTKCYGHIFITDFVELCLANMEFKQNIPFKSYK